MPGSGLLRLAEAAAVLSLATDLAMGQPLEHGLRTAVLGVRTAAALGLPEQDLTAVFYTGLLHFAGCTAGSEIDARFLGDELARGMATKQVARRLGISPKTCDHHIQRLYRKLGVSTRAGATVYAVEHGLLEPD